MSLSDNVCTQVPIEDLEKVWTKVAPLLEKALDNTYHIDDIFDGINKKRFQLFISWNKGIESAVITEVAVYPQAKILRYVLAGGTNLDNWLDRIQEKIERFAKLNNCTQLEVAGRRGWLKKLKNFKEKAILLTKEI